MIYRPRKKETLDKWLAGDAFSELMDTGDEHILKLIQVREEHGLDTAWIFYTALLFIEDNGLLAACKAATSLYEDALINSGYNEDIDYTPVVNFINRLRNVHGKSNNNRRYKWPVTPNKQYAGDVIVLANFLLYIVSRKIRYVNISRQREVRIHATLSIFRDDILPWFDSN